MTVRFVETVRQSREWTAVFRQYFEDEADLHRMLRDRQLSSVVCRLMKMVVDFGLLGNRNCFQTTADDGRPTTAT